MKSFFVLLATVLIPGNAFACELCKKNQPKVLEGITHGPGPQGDMDYIIIGVAIVIVGITLFLSLKFLIKPDEGNPDHIKNIVLDTNT
ncbi:MAG: hypothetical protein KF860_08905 [Cyclobacteriaceae bacterium]|nr:hypothetical protein [Cyclobacteriaceae bacterium]